MPARVAAGRRHLPGLGEDEHPGQDPDRQVGRRRRLAQLVVQRRDILRPDLPERLLSQGRQDVVLQRQAVVLRRARLAADLDMVLEAALREIGDGGLRRRSRILAPLDAVDDNSRLAPMLFDRLVADPPQRDPLQAGRPAGLDDVELAPGGVDPHAETGDIILRPFEGNRQGQTKGASDRQVTADV